MDSLPTVVITGISGFLGSQVCLAFLKDGRFTVRGTVRSKTNEAKIQPLKDAFGDYFDKLELVEADLTKKESLIAACQGATYIVHTASPFPMHQPKNEMDVIGPAVSGTLAIMEAAKQNQVKRVVMTSSCAAVLVPKVKPDVYDNTIFSDPNLGTPYEKSKTRAELAAWDYQKSLPEHERFELSVILPSFIVGPTLVKGPFSSADVVRQLMMGKVPGAPKILMPCIDVRDCAYAHLLALTTPEAANQRFILSDKALWFAQICEILRNRFGQQYGVVKGKMSKWIVCIGKHFNSDLRAVSDLWGKEMVVDNTRTKEVLGVEFRDVEQSFEEMGESMIQIGYEGLKAKKR